MSEFGYGLYVLGVILFFVGLGRLTRDAGVPDLDAAAEIMAVRMELDSLGKAAANSGDRAGAARVEHLRAVLADCIESQGFHNDDSCRWKPGGLERYVDEECKR